MKGGERRKTNYFCDPLILSLGAGFQAGGGCFGFLNSCFNSTTGFLACSFKDTSFHLNLDTCYICEMASLEWFRARKYNCGLQFSTSGHFSKAVPCKNKKNLFLYILRKNFDMFSKRPECIHMLFTGGGKTDRQAG